MKKITLYLIVFVMTSVFQSLGPKPKKPWEKENVSFPMMNQEIRHSLQEHDRQTEMRKKQIGNTATENVNRKQWSKFQETNKKIQDRLSIVSLAIQAIPTGIVIVQRTSSIQDNVQKIVYELGDAPYALIFALEDQISFLEDLQMTTQYILGLIISYGTINQMEKAERKILLDFAIEEFKRLDKTSYFLYQKIRDIKRAIRFKTNTIYYIINRDKQIVQDILNNIQGF